MIWRRVLIGAVLHTFMNSRSAEPVGCEGRSSCEGTLSKETWNKHRRQTSLSPTQGVKLESLVPRYTSAAAAQGSGPASTEPHTAWALAFLWQLRVGHCAILWRQGNPPCTMTPMLCPWLTQNPGSGPYEDGKGPWCPYSCFPLMSVS